MGISVDIADPERRVAALVRVSGADGEGGSWLTVDDGTATGGEAGPETLQLADDGERATVSMEVDAGLLHLQARRLVGVTLDEGSAFTDATGSTLGAFAARVEGEWDLGDRRRVTTAGRIVIASGEPDWARVELVRTLTAVLDDGSLLVVAAARPAGATGHGEEVVEAATVDADGTAIRFDETLLSTEYGPDGAHRRAGVELWAPGDAAPVRGAGTLIGGTREIAFLRFEINGTGGTARYELVRRA